MHRATRSLVLTALLVVGAGACKRGQADGPPCGSVGAKFLSLARDALEHSTLQGGSNEQLHRAVTDQLPAMRDSIVNACTDSAWSGAVRTCLVQAADHLAFEACEQQLTDAQRQALDRSARGASR